VFVNNLLWAVVGDPNDHVDGGLINSGTTVFIEGKLVIVNQPDNANPDALCIPIGGPHCNPYTIQGSGDTFAYGGGGAGQTEEVTVIPPPGSGE